MEKQKKLEKKSKSIKEKKINKKSFLHNRTLKEDFNKKDRFSIPEVTVLVLIAILFGAMVGSILTYTKERSVPSELREFVETYEDIQKNYYKKVNTEDLLDAAIKGMIQSLNDPYSTFMNGEETEEFNITVDGTYAGIGATVSINDNNEKAIISMFSKSPAEKAGLKVGDVFLKVNNKNVEKLNLEELTNLIKGKVGTKVKVTVKRGDKQLTKEVERQNVNIPSVTSKVVSKDSSKVGYLRIDVFAANTYNQLKNELENLEKQGITSLVLDVRDNPGGHLNQVTDILSLFLPKSKVIYQIETKGKKKKYYSLTKEKREYPIVVLINSSSASASEILAAGMQESYHSKVVGVHSYGKGSVQEAYSLSSGASLKYTTQKWLTPTGKSVDKKGVIPDIEVEESTEYITNPTEENDLQYQKAIDTAISEEKK